MREADEMPIKMALGQRGVSTLFARICDQLEDLRASGWVPKRVYISTDARLGICAEADAFFEPSARIAAQFQPGTLGCSGQVEWFVSAGLAGDAYEIVL